MSAVVTVLTGAYATVTQGRSGVVGWPLTSKAVQRASVSGIRPVTVSPSELKRPVRPARKTSGRIMMAAAERGRPARTAPARASSARIWVSHTASGGVRGGAERAGAGAAWPLHRAVRRALAQHAHLRRTTAVHGNGA